MPIGLNGTGPGLRGAWLARSLLALFRRRRGLGPGERIPGLQRQEPRVVIDPARLRRYREICGLPPGAPELPLCYPQLLAFGLQLELMLDPGFPLPVLGLIHVRNAITRHRAIRANQQLDLVCRIGDQREAAAGFELEVVTEVRASGVLCWESAASLLRRRRGRREEKRKPAPRLLPAGAQTRQILAPPGIGRRYAVCSGDFNPIHLHPLTARLFGFPSAIAHGMWSLARSLAELEAAGLELGEETQLCCDFKLPVLLPATLQLRWWQEESRTGFGLFSADGERPHLLGELAQLSPSVSA